MSTRSAITCLLPVRNGAELLGGWFESVGRFADAVVALDDGSTDATRSLLEQHALVARVLTNPVRESYAGWDDRANRMRLLEAVGELRSRWIVQLDADERIPADDAAVLRDFLLSAADPESGYLVRVHRMIGDLDHYDDANLEVGRIFAWRPGLHFPDGRLHFVALPTALPRDRYVHTTIRVQHLAGLTAEHRRARVDKYRESDPQCEFHPNYTSLLATGARRRRWQPRPAGLPVVCNGAWHREAEESKPPDDGTPVLSAVVIARNDERTIADAVQAVVAQECADPIEVIVVTSGADRTGDIVREQFPDVRLIELDGVALPGRARNAGLAAARGRYVSFPGSHVRLPPGSLATRIEAHRIGYAMVSGRTDNGTPTASGWASYFLDHNSVLPGRLPEPFRQAPAHCSYLRAALAAVGGFPEDLRAGEDTLVNNALFRMGYGAWYEPALRTVHNTPCRNPWRLTRHHFTRGRGFARVLLRQQTPGTRFLNRRTAESLVVRLVPGRLRRVHRAVHTQGDAGLRRTWRRVLPLAALATTASWAGMWVELLRPSTGGLRRLLRRTPA